MHLTKLFIYMLLSVSVLTVACSGSDDTSEEESFSATGQGVFVLCEGNFNAGNASLSYYDPVKKTVENGVFLRANGRKLGDTGQSIILRDGVAYIAVENSGVIWGIDAETFKVKGQVTTAGTKIINPRYIHFVSDTKAYVTDLYSPYINVFNPKSFVWTGAMPTGQEVSRGYCSTEEMVQVGKFVYTNCWSYSNKLLVFDTETDEKVREITLGSWQPKSMKADRYGKLWVIIDEYYYSGRDTGTQKTDEEYANDLDNFIRPIMMKREKDIEEHRTRYLRKMRTIIDPSAASFIEALERRKWYSVIKADNAVLDGIRETNTCMKNGYFKIARSCKNLIAELNGYVWDDKAEDDRPVKVNDHACLTGDTIVQTQDGEIPIKELVGKRGMVWSYNETTGEKELKAFDCVTLTKKDAQIYKVTLEDGTVVRCTGDHPLLTKRGYICAKYLKESDEIIKFD